MLMNVETILQHIERRGPNFPKEALREAAARGDEIVPALLAILERTLAAPDVVPEDYSGHLFAMALLAQLREERALDPVLRIARLPSDTLDDLTADFLTEDFPSILASVCGTDLGPVKALIEDPEVDEYARAAALKALTLRVVHGLLSRDELVAYHRYLLEEGLEREPSHAWDVVVNEGAGIHPGENLELLRRAFDEDRVDEICIRREDVEANARLTVEEVLARTRDRERGLVDDAVAATKWWAEARMPAEPKKNAVAKVGPNDRCPCGSGKKFKKCCWLKSLAR
jgi:hypothetical protein